MARPREFEETLALDRAMHLFWQRGFDGTSMEDLVQATGVHRGSIYSTFGDKQALFLKALDHYLNLEQSQLALALQNADSKLGVVRSILGGIAVDSTRPNGHGCFMVNSVIERSARDAKTRKRANDCFLRLTRLFETALTQARQTGELRKDADVGALALFLVNTIQGMRVLGKAGMTRVALQANVEIAMRALI